MPKEIPTRFDHEKEEPSIYNKWEASGYFNPDTCIKKKITSKRAKPFSIALPPPNVTGTLHMGHAMMLAIEDILIRYHRMRGEKTLWLPGTDHAAIATQAKVEAILYEKEKKTRHDLGREEFLDRVEAFAQESHDTIVRQLKAMGASLDWSREAYTFDEERGLAVKTAFKRLYDMGLIYRGARIVNWDPKLQTTVSDDEIEWIEEKAPFYYFTYGPFTIGTARPETKFGDKYVVMHPADKRYKKYTHGDTFTAEWINGPVTATVIKDKAIDPEFGTGVMTITPWHDATDFDIAERHKLDTQQIIDFDGRLLSVAQEFAGMPIENARPLIVEKLEKKGLLVKADEKYVHRIATNSRGGGIIEPQIKEQWFVTANKSFRMPHSGVKGIRKGTEVTLKELMRTAVKSGQINIVPKRFQKTYFHWIDNLRDWCISRQLWYGHRIPVWYRKQEVYVGVEQPKGTGWEQDPDTLDTWFSSGLWTFSTLGWPQKTSDLTTYHPTSVLETGYDILFFWVARMILMSTALLGEIPFKTVYLHGLVRDEEGRKMSKSLGNIIDPLDMAKKFGADATRMSLIVGNGPGNDLKLSEDKIKAYRNFTTKVWNIARFVLMNRPEGYPSASSGQARRPRLSRKDKKFLDGAEKTKKQVAAHIEKLELHLAAEVAYHYTWHTFADEIIEAYKSELRGEDNAARVSAYHLLESILMECLTMLHPFMPFVTERIYQELRPNELLLIKKW